MARTAACRTIPGAAATTPNNPRIDDACEAGERELTGVGEEYPRPKKTLAGALWAAWGEAEVTARDVALLADANAEGAADRAAGDIADRSACTLSTAGVGGLEAGVTARTVARVADSNAEDLGCCTVGVGFWAGEE